MNNFSSACAPSGKSAVAAEITAPEASDAWKMSDRDINDSVINSLASQGIIDKAKVCCSRLQRARYAYIVYDMDYEKNISVIKEFVRAAGMELLGRFAEFEYINMDEVIKRAKKIADRLNA
jgi:protoporphyrinogen oxidase